MGSDWRDWRKWRLISPPILNSAKPFAMSEKNKEYLKRNWHFWRKYTEAMLAGLNAATTTWRC